MSKLTLKTCALKKTEINEDNFGGTVLCTVHTITCIVYAVSLDVKCKKNIINWDNKEVNLNLHDWNILRCNLN